LRIFFHDFLVNQPGVHLLAEPAKAKPCLTTPQALSRFGNTLPHRIEFDNRLTNSRSE
jgi:hypothetical protein